MSQLEKRVGRQLEWRRERVFSHRSTLYDGDEAVATLQLFGLFGRRARFEAGGTRWIFRRPGLFGMDVIVQSDVSSEPFARFRGRWWSGGALSLPNDRELSWMRESVMGRRWAFTRGDEPLVRFESHVLSLKSRTWMTVEPAGGRLPEVDLLAGLGWLLILRRRKHRSH